MNDIVATIDLRTAPPSANERRMKRAILHWYDAYMNQFNSDANDVAQVYGYRCRQLRRLAMDLDSSSNGEVKP